MEKLGNWLASAWYPIAMTLAAFLFVGILVWFQLGSLPAGYSEAELTQAQQAKSLHVIRENPLNFPHKVTQKSLDKVGVSLPLAGRAASALIGLGLVGGFFFVLRQWYTRRVAFLGTVLFACSAWFLHIARSGTDGIMYASLFIILTCVVWMQERHSGMVAVMASALATVALLYTPGMIWFIAPVVWWQFGRISRFLHRQKPGLLVAVAVLGVGLVTPLVWALYSDPSLIRTYVGLPASLPNPLEFAKNLIGVPIELFVRGPNTFTDSLGRLPYVDWFGGIMFVIGVYAYYFKWRLDRTRFFAYIFGMSTFLVALGGPVSISILSPFVYVIIAGGIALMLQQWFTVFPRNPVARTTGAVLMTIAILMSVFYNVNQYFIAWPNTPETKQIFVEQAE